MLSGFEQLGVHLRGAAHDERVGIREVGQERSRRTAVAGVNRPARFRAQQFERGGGKIVGNDNFQCVNIILRIIRDEPSPL
jgi:hypothetical protein